VPGSPTGVRGPCPPRQRAGPRLLALPGELVWATTWQGEANEVIAPRLGLPGLPVVTWPDAEVDADFATLARWLTPAGR